MDRPSPPVGEASLLTDCLAGAAVVLGLGPIAVAGVIFVEIAGQGRLGPLAQALLIGWAMAMSMALAAGLWAVRALLLARSGWSTPVEQSTGSFGAMPSARGCPPTGTAGGETGAMSRSISPVPAGAQSGTAGSASPGDTDADSRPPAPPVAPAPPGAAPPARTAYPTAAAGKSFPTTDRSWEASPAAAEVRLWPGLPSPAPAPPDWAQRLAQLERRIEQVHEDVLLDDAQRAARRRDKQTREADELAARAELAIEAQAFDEAEQAIAALGERTGQSARADALRRRAAEARQAEQSSDIERTRHEIEGLMAVSDFRGARQRAMQLVQRVGPGEADALLAHVRREASAFVQQHARRLYEEIRRCADSRRWPEALTAARRLMREYGESSEAQLVGGMIPTLEVNARLAEVRQLRDEIRELLQRKRYPAALARAREVVDRFPETAAASELRDQMPRLESLAGAS